MICGRKSTLFSRAQELGMVQTDRTTGLPCFEISDHDSRIKLHPDQIAERQEPVILGDVLDHPRLFTAYPFLKEIKVVATPGGIDSCGTNGRQIFMRHPFPQSLDYQGAILHEIQHIIQGAEGFSIGSNPAFFLEGMEMTPVVSLAHLLVKQTDHSGFWNKVEEIALTEYGPQCLGELQKARSIGRSDPETDNKGMPEVPAVVESFVREARCLAEAAYDSYFLCDGELMACETGARRLMPPELRELVRPLSFTGRAYEIPPPPYSLDYERNHDLLRQVFNARVCLSELCYTMNHPPPMTPDQVLPDLDSGPAMLFRSVGKQPYMRERLKLPAVFRSERALPYDPQSMEMLGIRRAPLSPLSAPTP